MKFYPTYNHRQKQLSKKQMDEIDNRRLYAMKSNDIESIEDAKTKILAIIDTVGLNNDDDRIKLETALKILPYIFAQKKQTEIIATTKKIEDIIRQYAEDAQIIE